jgi:hypothetical protein
MLCTHTPRTAPAALFGRVACVATCCPRLLLPVVALVVHEHLAQTYARPVVPCPLSLTHTPTSTSPCPSIMHAVRCGVECREIVHVLGPLYRCPAALIACAAGLRAHTLSPLSVPAPRCPPPLHPTRNRKTPSRYLLALPQPSRPATAIDATFLQRSGLGTGPNGELQTTYSIVSGLQYTTVFGAVLASDYPVSTTDLGYGPSDSVVVIEANTTSTFSVVAPGASLTVKACGKWDFQLYSVAPLLPNGVCVCAGAVRGKFSGGWANWLLLLPMLPSACWIVAM